VARQTFAREPSKIPITGPTAAALYNETSIARISTLKDITGGDKVILYQLQSPVLLLTGVRQGS
jgi:hypothetical protein